MRDVSVRKLAVQMGKQYNRQKNNPRGVWHSELRQLNFIWRMLLYIALRIIQLTALNYPHAVRSPTRGCNKEGLA